jgi:hypothetical protein
MTNHRRTAMYRQINRLGFEVWETFRIQGNWKKYRGTYRVAPKGKRELYQDAWSLTEAVRIAREWKA